MYTLKTVDTSGNRLILESARGRKTKSKNKIQGDTLLPEALIKRILGVKYIQLKLPDDIHKQVKLRATEKGLSILEFAVEALQQKTKDPDIEALIDKKIEEKLK